MNTENLSTLVIHKLTQDQYNRVVEEGEIDENALYLTPDEMSASTSKDVITIPGGATATVPSSAGEGPYVIEFTEETLSIPPATPLSLGLVKIGAGLEISEDGLLSLALDEAEEVSF